MYKATKEILEKKKCNFGAFLWKSSSNFNLWYLSSYGIGTVLSHVLPNCTELPIAYYSCMLTKPERNYSQTDHKALPIISAVKKFYQYLQGWKWKIITEHTPLLGFFNPNKPFTQMILPCVLRWSLLSSYDYELEYRRGKEISHADIPRSLPLHFPDFDIPALADLLLEKCSHYSIKCQINISVNKEGYWEFHYFYMVGLQT